MVSTDYADYADGPGERYFIAGNLRNLWTTLRSLRQLLQKLVGFGNRTVHLLEQMVDLRLDLRRLAAQRRDRLGVEAVFEREDVVVELVQHRVHAPLRFLERRDHAIVT